MLHSAHRTYAPGRPLRHGLCNAGFVLLALGICGSIVPSGFAQSEATHKGHIGADLTPPKDAPYVLSDGSIYIAGNDLIEPFLDQINDRFAEQHHGFAFKMDSLSSGVAIAGIVSGKSAFGPTARDVTFIEKDAFASVYGYPVTDVLIGWDNSPDADRFPPGKFPPTVWVNAKNPVASLSLEQVAAIFTSGSPKGDITRWGQIRFHEAPVGNNGADYAKREIHVYIPSLHGLPVVSTNRARFGDNLTWTRRAEYLPLMEDVVNAVANDPFGIGITGWFPIDEGWDRQLELGPKIRLLPLSVTAESKSSHGGPGDLYPLAGGLHLLINRAPGKPIDPWLKEYVRLILSKEGQDILGSMTKTDGFIPLTPAEAEKELQKVE
jgi:phosphate transport system substrate-binding protein